MSASSIHVLNTATLRPIAGGEVPTQCLLVERDDGLMAVDSGLSRSLLLRQQGLSFERYFIRPPKLESLALVSQVQALGFHPRDVATSC